MMRVMIDNETLALGPNAVIFEVGVVFWEGTFRHVMGFQLDIFEQIVRGREINAKTVEWWRGRERAPRLRALDQVEDMVEEISAAFLERKPAEVWANSPAFDLVQLSTLYEQFGHVVPWTHKQERDVRTITKFLDVELPEEEVRHQGIADCENQIRRVNYILNMLQHQSGD